MALQTLRLPRPVLLESSDQLTTLRMLRLHENPLPALLASFGQLTALQTLRGETAGTVEYTGINTFFGKTAALLADTEELSNVQHLLLTIVRNLTVLSLVMCLIVLYHVWTIVPFMEPCPSWWC